MKKALILVVLLAQTLCYHAQFSQQTNLYDAGFVDSPHFLRMGDIDGDGINDLVFCNGSQGGELEYVRGNADGTFDTDEVALYGNNEFQNITTFEVADIDEDGDDDIAAYVDGSPNGDLYLLENNSGSFSSPQLILENIGNLTNVRIADLGQDGLKDIIICEVYSGAPEILYQTSPFVFNYVDTSNNGIPTEGGRYLELQDIDNDGDQDIKFHGTGDIGVALNNGSGEFTDSFVLSGPNISNQEVLVEDFDNDGDFEVVRMTYDGIEFLEWIDGELIFAYDISIDEDAFFTGMLTEDFNLDGFPDLVFYCWSSCTTSVVMNDGTGQMNHTIPLCGMTSIPERGLITQYLNSDGAPDIVACRSSNRVIRGIQNELPLCSDPGACNYNSEYSGDDLNCNYNNCGCVNDDAENYNPDAINDDGSCEFEATIRLYHDADANGTYSNNTDAFLPGIFVTVNGQSTSTDTYGNAQFNIESGLHDIQINLPEQFLYVNFEGTPQLNSSCDGGVLLLGIVGVDQLQAGEVNVFPYSNTTTCDQPSSAEVCFNNSGTTNENFILNIALGDVAGDLTEVNSSGDVDFSGGNASIVFDELDAGEVECVNIVWQNPDFNSLGENININADLNIVVDGEEQNLASTNFSTELTCAYDPNDKRVWPEGEYEQNYVPIGTSIDYMIRFQNTGNGNATNVVLRDTLDENLNELSFLLKGQSHNMLFEFDHTSREMVFTFPNINLPPSESDEPGSHGFVSFELSHNEDLIATTPVTNTAHIYFDANPAIVTNTTLTTFYNCDDFFASFDTDLIPHCAGTSAELVSFTPDAESFLWQLDGQTISESGTCDLSDLSLGGHTLSLEVDHPLCQANNSVFFEVIDCGNSISEITTALGPIVVFPNPCSSETVNIKLPSRPSKRSELLIFNSFGQEVLRMAKSNVNDELIQINVHELPKGLYFIQFIENGTSRTARMILK